jgi:DnaJ-class molecular chaperone
MFFPPQNNYYEILGIKQTANETDIKNAYRKLSLKYHPDRNKEPTAQRMFQELGEAYETLSDPEKKRQYDMNCSGQPQDDLNNIFNMMFAGGQHPFQNVQIFSRGHPSGHPGGHPGGFPRNFEEIFHQMQRPKPERIEKQITITIEQSFHGCNLPIEIERVIVRGEERTKETETIYIPIPPGIDNNEKILLQNKGHCVNDVVNGDVYLTIQVINQSSFQREGLDLFFKKNISLKEALLGFTFDIHHLNGQVFSINNTQIIQPYFKKKLSHLGMIRENNRGNLWIEFYIQFPETLTEQQTNALKEIF